MTNKMESLQDKLMAFTAKIQSNIYVKAISAGLMSGMGVLIAGTLINLMINFPITAFTDFLTNIGLMSFLTEVQLIFQLTVPVYAFLMAYNIAKEKKVDPIQAGVASFMNYLLVSPVAYTEEAEGYILFDTLTATNIATCIIVSLITGALFSWAIHKKIVIKLPDSMPAFVKISLESIPAACITVVPFILVRYGFSLTSFETFGNFITTIIAAPLSGLGNSIGGHMVFLFLNSLVWWFGIHNTPIVTVAMVVMLPSMTENLTAFYSGLAAPNDLSMMSWLFIMQLFGGTGMTIGLSIDTLAFAKSKRYKAQGKVQIIPSIFNINEPCMFGMPIILNPTFFVPFTLGPVACYLLYYIGVKLGLFTVPLYMLNTFIPGFIQGILCGGGVGFGIYCLLLVGVSMLIWLPFVKIADKAALKEEQAAEAVQNV